MSAAVHHQRRALPEDVAEDWLRFCFGIPLEKKKDDDVPQYDTEKEKRPEPNRKR